MGTSRATDGGGTAGLVAFARVARGGAGGTTVAAGRGGLRQRRKMPWWEEAFLMGFMWVK